MHTEGVCLCCPVAGVEVRLEGSLLVSGLSWCIQCAPIQTKSNRMRAKHRAGCQQKTSRELKGGLGSRNQTVGEDKEDSLQVKARSNKTADLM